MSTRDDDAAAAAAAPGPQAGAAATDAPVDPERAPWTGRSAWVFPALVASVGAVALWGAATIETPPHSSSPGPTLFPAVIGALLVATAARMAVVNLRVRRAGTAAAWPGTDWPPVLVILGSLLAHLALLEVLGWLLAGALLFWGVAYAFGARAPGRDALVALAMAAAVQVGFSFGLGLPLPGGVVETVLETLVPGGDGGSGAAGALAGEAVSTWTR